ncbi:ubiquitin conjugation factor E4 A [Hyalella azteca]|uniref:Ubiquitin conjugation factor E4 A n=1 Tax=Hyalella azteca TaxID=294128 RepID=A0A8B7P4W2_HYAAZ|nr:ubiquitin conjugation factor E4 A [Hyalella azteca]
MAEDLQKNEFAALFPSVEAAHQFQQRQHDCSGALPTSQLPLKEETSAVPSKNEQLSSYCKETEISCLLEYLLLCTSHDVSINSWHACVKLPDSALSVDSTDTLLFERLMLEQPYSLAGPNSTHPNRTTHWGSVNAEAVVEVQVLFYLFEVYERCSCARKKIKSSKGSLDNYLSCVEELEEHVIVNFHTAIHEPDIYVGQNVHEQLKKLLQEKLTESEVFDELVVRYVTRAEAEGSNLPEVFSQILDEVKTSLKDSELMAVDWLAVRRLAQYCIRPSLATILLTVPAPGALWTGPQVAGAAYEATALGCLLAISALPASPLQPSAFFVDAARLTRQEVNAVNSSISSTQAIVNERTFEIFSALLKNKATRHMVMKWLEGCVASNLGRAGLWHVAGEGSLTATQYASDGFMINLGAVLARLAHKFTEGVVVMGEGGNLASQHAIMKVDPSYCVSGKSQAAGERIPGSYPASLDTLTPLIPPAEGDKAHPPLPQQYTFVTACFFFAHAALNLGMAVTVSRLERVQRDLNRLHQENRALDRSADPTLRTLIRDRVSLLTSSYLTLRAALLPQSCSPHTTHLLAATAHWLVQIAQLPLSPWDSCPRLSVPVQTPIPETADQDPVPHKDSWLQFIPEMLVDNIARLATLYRMLNADDNTPLFDLPVNKHYITFIISFMGSSSRIKNPYLRAQLAQTLEVLLLGEPLSSASDLTRTSRFASQLPAIWQQLVEQHPLAEHLVPSVVRVFVSIEMTGQNVAFEDKFKYRGPMYEILKQLWQVPEQRAVLVGLAVEALENMESTKPPLMLRFINLLINDNIFLLDEGLTYMAQLREMTLAKERGDWTALAPAARQEKEQMLMQTGMMARFHNVLARRTSSTLLMLTEEHELASLLCHRTMVERVAHMLNFFLDHLVGPKQRQLKVRDAEQYEFQPGVMVAIICRMYCNLTQLPLFPAAVIADGRSYSPKLLQQARSVLHRIGEYTVAEHMAAVEERVAAVACTQQEEEDLTAAAPAHFLDPILSVLMRDPVKLPSSEVVVERSTIARHLLSDQSDPFNRQPLTMDQVIPDVVLAKEIHEWIESKTAELRRERKENEALATQTNDGSDNLVKETPDDMFTVTKKQSRCEQSLSGPEISSEPSVSGPETSREAADAPTPPQEER